MNDPKLAVPHRRRIDASLALRVLAAAVATSALAIVGLRYAHADHMTHMPRASEVLPGRSTPMPVAPRHLIKGTPLDAPFPGMQRALFGMGCFWSGEEHFFQLPGVISTAAGYAGGSTPNPTYEEVSSGRTGHAEVVEVVFDPRRVSYEQLLHVFWEGHDPTEGMRQGNDVGTNYRSTIFTFGDEQQRAAVASRQAYGSALTAAGYGPITTEIRAAPTFYFAEGYHQQYCYANPEGYCHHGGTGVPFPGAR
jgi:peptide-methionine (S)-S-oxide reductase